MVFRFSIFLIAFITIPVYGAWFFEPVLQWHLKPTSRYWASISSSDGFILRSPDKKRAILKDMHVALFSRGTRIFFNNKLLQPGRYYLLPKEQAVEIEGVWYKGPLSLYVTSHSLVLCARKYQKSEQLDTVWLGKNKRKIQSLSYKVRVLLDEQLFANKRFWTLACDNGFILIDSERNKTSLSKDELVVSFKRGALYLNNRKLSGDWIQIAPEEGFVSVDGSAYHGSFTIMKEHDRLLLINTVDLEEYVYSVLRTESWPGWPLEVNKAFAIASRSYVMAMMKASKITKLPYHVRNTNKHQTYSGIHDCLTSRAAVDQTRGVFLSHNKEPIVAMFDCCCGGVIPALMEDFDFKKAPYLARTYPCNHCKNCKLYSWEAVFDSGVMHNLVAHMLDNDRVKDVKVARKDKAGLVKEVSVKAGKKSATVTGKQIYSLSKEIKSFYFGIQRKGDKLVFKGRGYGHHLGICQWGAREMVKEGWSYKDVLQFYYPGTQFLRLNL